jgi:hypothetical protein
MYYINSHYCIFVLLNTSLKIAEKDRNIWEGHHTFYVILSNSSAVVGIGTAACFTERDMNNFKWLQFILKLFLSLCCLIN